MADNSLFTFSASPTLSNDGPHNAYMEPDGMLEGEQPWNSVFAVAIWMLWKWRCSNSLEEHRRYPNQLADVVLGFIRNWERTMRICKNREDDGDAVSCWTPPPPNFFKINVDGSRLSETGQITAGGIIRNEHADWVKGFMFRIGRGSVLEAEFWAIMKGIILARNLGIDKLWVESDSKEAVDLIQLELCRTNHPCTALISDIKENLKSFTSWKISHIPRALNEIADSSANKSHSLGLGLHTLHDPLILYVTSSIKAFIFLYVLSLSPGSLVLFCSGF